MKKSLLWQSVALVDSQLWLAVITGNSLPRVQRVLLDPSGMGVVHLFNLCLFFQTKISSQIFRTDLLVIHP